MEQLAWLGQLIGVAVIVGITWFAARRYYKKGGKAELDRALDNIENQADRNSIMY